MTNLSSITHTIDNRYNMLMLDAERAVSQADINQASTPEAAQEEPQRALLRVEKIAQRDKELNKKSEQSFINGIRDLVHDNLLERLTTHLADTDDLYRKVLGFDDNLATLLDSLTVRASSISKLEPHASSMPWLYDDLIKLLNMPKYRRVDSKGNVIKVDSMRVALSFLGIENLKMVIPSLAFRRWMPQITDPFPKIKTQLWEEALAAAISAKKLAELSKVDPSHAFILGMFHDIGRIVLVRLYFRLFDSVQQDALTEAHNDKKKEEYSALTKMQPSATFLNTLCEQHAFKISSSLISKMDFKRVFISKAMQEFSDSIAIQHATPMSKVLTQARAYTKYRILKKNKLISMDESKAYLSQFELPAGALSALKTIDLRQLNLNLDEE